MIKMGIQIIIDCMMWLGLGLNIAMIIRARRLSKEADAKLDEAMAANEKTMTLVQFSKEFNQCETADDIIDLQQRWHDRLKEVGLDFNDIVKFDIQ